MTRILVTGAAGLLGRALTEELATTAAVVALTRADLDVTDAAAVRTRIGDERPDIVIQCAAYVNTDRAEGEPERAISVNARATEHVAAACREIDALLVYPSSDYVFDGGATTPYSPDASTSPVNAYGRSKLAGERAARSAGRWLVVRTSWLFGPGGRNFVRTMIAAAREGRQLRVVDDQRGSPTWSPELAVGLRRLIEAEPGPGVHHLSNAGHTTWYELARAACDLAGVPASIEPVTSEAYGSAARRPAYSVLDCSATYRLTGALRDWRDALREAIETGAY